MSYTIVYGKQFLKTSDGKIIPLILAGSNNCYIVGERGRERREREWQSITGGANNSTCFTEAEIHENIDSWIGGTYQEHFMMYGKWVNDAKLLKFVKSGIKNAKTIEELNELSRYPISLKAYISVWYTDGETYNDGTLKTKEKIESKCNIMNSRELNEFLVKANERIHDRLESESIYVCIQFESEKVVPFPKEMKRKNTPVSLTEYYALKVATRQGSYLKKLTSRRIIICYNVDCAKQFRTEQEAVRWLEKNRIEKRFNTRFEIEFSKSNISA